MFTRNFVTKLSIALALATIVAAGTIWEIARVNAKGRPTAVEFQPAFGMLGITRGQTVRLNLVNLTQPNNKGQIPPPCRVVLSFRDANGRPFTDSDGQVVRREVSLEAGDSAFIDLNGDGFGPPSTNGGGRLQLRPFVRVLSAPPEPDRGNLPPPCVPTAEVFDNATGRTSLFTGGLEPPPDPDRGQ